MTLYGKKIKVNGAYKRVTLPTTKICVIMIIRMLYTKSLFLDAVGCKNYKQATTQICEKYGDVCKGADEVHKGCKKQCRFKRTMSVYKDEIFLLVNNVFCRLF